MIVITGASKGIGKFLFNKYSLLGEDVIGLYNNTVPDVNEKDKMFKVDISDFCSINNFVTMQKEKLKNIILINCAGVNYSKFAHEADIEKWTNVIMVNLVGTFNLISVLLPLMRNSNYGRIINFSSVVAQKGIVGTSAYAASKSGLWGMSKAIAQENAAKNITINNINLGYFDIGMIKEVPEKYLSNVIAQIPSNNLGQPQDIFNTVEYLVRTKYINGTNVDLNGGLI